MGYSDLQTIIWPSPDPYLTLISSLQLKKSYMVVVVVVVVVDQPITNPISGPSFDLTIHYWPWAWQLSFLIYCQMSRIMSLLLVGQLWKNCTVTQNSWLKRKVGLFVLLVLSFDLCSLSPVVCLRSLTIYNVHISFVLLISNSVYTIQSSSKEN